MDENMLTFSWLVYRLYFNLSTISVFYSYLLTIFSDSL
ncbi:MAG: hypothetical protein JETT_2136 [Candidatus Jettenia ecosi]|uniref:Uncharacterized protein n=1 Tax=Candidatus Jettenia ecosi TaxID=2494326 RepID=A0A533QLY2_9BACT|nr:MAG: hypothetical protein JETT_2136 [Candidatus Jettenia ecosi]